MKTFSSPFRAGANLLLLVSLSLPVRIFAQGNGNANPQMQIQNLNYYDQIDNNNSLGNNSNKKNDDINPIQTNLGNLQANPSAQEQQQKSQESVFGSETNDNVQEKTKCKDCDAVHKAMKAAAHSSSAPSTRGHGKTFSFNGWLKKISGRMDIKIKKIFSHQRKFKTNYEVCYNWR